MQSILPELDEQGTRMKSLFFGSLVVWSVYQTVIDVTVSRRGLVPRGQWEAAQTKQRERAVFLR